MKVHLFQIMGFEQLTILLLIFSHGSLVSKGQSTTEVTELDGQFHAENNSTEEAEPAVVKALKDYLTKAAAEEYEIWFWIAIGAIAIAIAIAIGALQ